MFRNKPNILAHVSALKDNNFVLQESIIVKNNDVYDIKNRECPHRGYLISNPGETLNVLSCKLHGFSWKQDGSPMNEEPYCKHFYKMQHQGQAILGDTGILFENFQEPKDQEWFKILCDSPELYYSHSVSGSSEGSWLWLMEQMTDLLHLIPEGIHPIQSIETPLDSIKVEFGDNWSIQMYTTRHGTKGFWLFVYPGFNIEYEHGKLMICRVSPFDPKLEYGFTWHMQFYYADSIGSSEKTDWEKVIEVYKEDINAIENIRRPYFPLKKTVNKWEEQSKHWADWYLSNKI